jgi:hypothetical protein
MAIDEKESKELTKAQKGLNKKFTELTTRMGEVNGTLAKEAANLRKSSRDTFQGMLNARKLAKVSEAIANDMQLQQLGEHIDNLNEDNKELQKAHDDIIKEREDSLKTDESLNTKREQLEALQTNLDTNIYTSKKAEKAAQESANALQRQITKETTDISNIYAEDIETAALELKQSEEVLKEQRKLQAERMEMYSDQLEDASKDGNFSKFSDGLKELSGDTIDLGDTFNKVVKKFNAIKNIIESLGKFRESLEGLSSMLSGKVLADFAMKFPVIGGLITKIGTGLMSVLTKIDTMFGFIGKGIMAVGRGIKNLVKLPFQLLSKAWTFLSTGIASMATGFMNIAKSMMTGVKAFAKSVYTFIAGGLKSAATAFISVGKKLITGAKRMILAASGFIFGLLAAAAGMFMAALPMIGIALAVTAGVAALVFGVMWLVKKFTENKDEIMFKWGLIQEGFSIAIDGLILWKDIAVSFISNTFKSIWLSIKSLFSAITTGIENGINNVIQGINKFLPDWAKIDEVDIGAKGMAAGLNEEKAAFAIEKEKEQKGFADRKDDLVGRAEDVKSKWNDEGNWVKPPEGVENGNMIKDATAEVKQGEKQGNVAVITNQTNANTNNSTQIHTGSGSPRDADRTAISLNAIAT